MTTSRNDTAAMSIAEANATMTAPGELFEMEELDIRGVPTRTWKNQPPSLRSVLDMSLGHGDATFLVYEDERTTFAEHYRIVATLAHRLRDEFGIAKGDRVAIVMRNIPEWVMAFWAAAAARRHRGAAQRMVEWRGAALRPRGLGLHGRLRRHGASRAHPSLSSAGSRVCGPSSSPTSTASSPRRRSRSTSRRVARHRSRSGPSRSRWARWMRTPHRLTSRSSQRTTPPSSTPRAPRAGRRAPSAPNAT